MNAHYVIKTDPNRDLLRIEMAGFFQVGDVAAFTRELTAKMPTLRCAANQHITLIDISRMKIQAQDVVAMFARVVGHDQFRSKRLAFVVGSSLSRMQARRLTSRPGVAFFGQMADAENWLFDRPVSASAARYATA